MSFIYHARTGLMFVVLTGLLCALGALLGWAFAGRWLIGTGIMLIVTLVMVFVSYFFSKEMALKANRARIITESENPRLYRIVREVAEKAGVPMPEVGISPTMQPNAFATGRNPSNAAVVATRGILELLPDDELRGVIAHEMSHVKNRDILVMSIASAISSMISYISSMLMWAVIFSDRDSQERLALTVIAILAQIFVPIAALLVQLGISRNREYLADETGAKIIRDPRALARALTHLESGIDYTNAHTESKSHGQRQRTEKGDPSANYNYAHMWIANPLKKGTISKLFSTHPPMEERIERLNNLAKEMGL